MKQTPTFYPSAEQYFVRQVSEIRPIFQGDLFAGVFGAFWAHPVAVAARRAGAPAPHTQLQFPKTTDLLNDVYLDGTYGLLLPHPCDFAEDGKGAVQPQRLIAPVFPASRTKVPLKQLRSGSVGNLIWIPSWSSVITEQDWYADLRYCTSVDAAFLARGNRLAAMSPGSWLALNDKLTRYFTGIAMDRARFVIQRSDLHPDCPTATEELPA